MRETTESQPNMQSEDLRGRAVNQVERPNCMQLSILKLRFGYSVWGMGVGCFFPTPLVCMRRGIPGPFLQII